MQRRRKNEYLWRSKRKKRYFTFLLLSDYRRYLSEKDDEETTEMLNIIDYYLDIFTSNYIEEKLEFYKYNKKVVQDINERFIKKDSWSRIFTIRSL